MWTCDLALDAATALAFERWSPPLVKSLERSPHWATSARVCACTSPIQISLETVDRHFKTHSPRALLYLIWRARTGAEIILFKKKKVNQTKEKISNVTVQSRESPSSSPPPTRLFFLCFLLHCRCGEGTPPQKITHTRGPTCRKKSAKKIKAWLTHRRVLYQYKFPPYTHTHKHTYTPSKIMWLNLVNGVYCFLPKDSCSSIRPLIHLLIILAAFSVLSSLFSRDIQYPDVKGGPPLWQNKLSDKENLPPG